LNRNEHHNGNDGSYHGASPPATRNINALAYLSGHAILAGHYEPPRFGTWEVRFAGDSPLEGKGFELPVRGRSESGSDPCTPSDSAA
jgi:hypothetical protein